MTDNKECECLNCGKSSPTQGLCADCAAFFNAVRRYEGRALVLEPAGKTERGGD